VRSEKLTYWIRWSPEADPIRHRTRKPVRLGGPLYKGLSFVGRVFAMGWEGDKFVLDLG
jgi:hypothetical protein